MIRNKGKYDLSILVAMVAVLISIFSTFISLRETEILSSQLETSAWPYIENSYLIRTIDSSYVIEYSAKNKGIGPAIIDSVVYRFKEEELVNWKFHSRLQSLYPNVRIDNSGNAELSRSVLAPGEAVKIFVISISNGGTYDRLEFNRIVNEIASNIYLKYCYCSVYGKCWEVDGYEIEATRECSIPNGIR